MARPEPNICSQKWGKARVGAPCSTRIVSGPVGALFPRTPNEPSATAAQPAIAQKNHFAFGTSTNVLETEPCLQLHGTARARHGGNGCGAFPVRHVTAKRKEWQRG